MKPTSTTSSIPFRPGDFSTLTEALDYAAHGDTGYNFYNGAGKLQVVLPYAELSKQAQITARRLLALQLERGSRVAIVTETHHDFLRFFFACQYAGLVLVPLPAPIRLGGRDAYISQIQRLLNTVRASVAIAQVDLLAFLLEAAKGQKLRFIGTPDMADDLTEFTDSSTSSRPEELAYIQFTSGSTRFPRGVMVTQEAVLHNVSANLNHGAKIRTGDRCVSWLPYFHDLGLVGLVLAPMAAQISVDYLNTRDFALRPRLFTAALTFFS
jgi:fatty-acyl-CoA synthase